MMVKGLVMATAVVCSAGGGLMSRRGSRTRPREDTKLDRGYPPEPPPEMREMGSYCIRARCKFLRDGAEVGNVTGHDDQMAIVAVVEEACRANAAPRGLACSQVAVTILPDLPGRICDGIVFDVHDSENDGLKEKYGGYGPGDGSGKK